MAGYLGIYDTDRNIANLITNGNLDTNTTGWSYNSSYYDIDQSNGYLTITVKSGVDTSGTSTQAFYQNLSPEPTGTEEQTEADDQIIYFQAEIKGARNNSGYPRLYTRYFIKDSTTASTTGLSAMVDIDTGQSITEETFKNDSWHTIGIYVHTRSANSYARSNSVRFGISPTNKPGDTMSIRNVKVINLTNVFGHGNEPVFQAGMQHKIFDTGHEVKDIYVGVNNTARIVRRAFIGVGGVARLWHESLPTFAELFGGWQHLSHNAWNESSVATRSFSRPSNAVNGETWYLFYFAGGSMEVSRIYTNSDGTTMTKTRLGYQSDDTSWFGTKMSADGTVIETGGTMRACSMVMLCFKHPPFVVERMFELASIGTHQFYRNSTQTNADNDLQIERATVTAKPGVIFAAFRDGSTSKNCWSVNDSQTPTTAIVGARTGTSGSTISALRGYTNSVQYLGPTADGTSTASVRSYTLKWLKENW